MFPEAYIYEKRPLVYGILRRRELLAYVWFTKRMSGITARLRATFIVLCGHETEICEKCGRGVNLVWWCEDGSYEQATNITDGSGCFCIPCFNSIAEKSGIYLRWLAKKG